MELILLDDERLLRRAALWLDENSDRDRLDFGVVQPLEGDTLRAMLQDQAHVVRAFTADRGAEAIGLVGLAGVNRDFRSATLWALLGDARHAADGYLLRAAAAMLTLGFSRHGLECVNAWAVAGDRDSLRILERLGFTAIGRQRGWRRHDGQTVDRLLFELQANDHRSHPDVRKPSAALQ